MYIFSVIKSHGFRAMVGNLKIHLMISSVVEMLLSKWLDYIYSDLLKLILHEYDLPASLCLPHHR